MWALKSSLNNVINDVIKLKLKNVEEAVIHLKKEELKGKSTPVEIGIFDNNRLIEKSKLNFIGPAQ